MPTTTTNYSWNKPTVGGDEDAWGGYLNGNWDDLDTTLKTVEDKADAADSTGKAIAMAIVFG